MDPQVHRTDPGIWLRMAVTDLKVVLVSVAKTQLCRHVSGSFVTCEVLGLPLVPG